MAQFYAISEKAKNHDDVLIPLIEKEAQQQSTSKVFAYFLGMICRVIISKYVEKSLRMSEKAKGA